MGLRLRDRIRTAAAAAAAGATGAEVAARSLVGDPRYVDVTLRLHIGVGFVHQVILSGLIVLRSGYRRR